MQPRKVRARGADLSRKRKTGGREGGREGGGREKKGGGRFINRRCQRRSDRSGSPSVARAFYSERRLSALIVRARVHNEACIVPGFFVYSTVKSAVRSG